MNTKKHIGYKKFKCTKISYDPEYAIDNLKKTMTVEVGEGMVECIALEDGYAEMTQYLIDEVSEITGCPVLDLEWKAIA